MVLPTSFIEAPKRQNRHVGEKMTTPDDSQISEIVFRQTRIQGSTKVSRHVQKKSAETGTPNQVTDSFMGSRGSCIDAIHHSNTIIDTHGSRPTLKESPYVAWSGDSPTPAFPSRVHTPPNDIKSDPQAHQLDKQNYKLSAAKVLYPSTSCPHHVAPVTPANLAPHRHHQSPKVHLHVNCNTTETKKREAPNSWMISQRKQQRTQRRAFASNNDNPFAFFQHDPNDAESYLETLSSSSIIPDEVMPRSAYVNKRCEPFTQPQIFRGRGPINSRRHKGLGRPQRVSNHDVLRQKAQEACWYSGKRSSVQQQRMSSTTTAIPEYRLQSQDVDAYAITHDRLQSATCSIPLTFKGPFHPYTRNAFVSARHGYTLPQEKFCIQPNQYFENVSQTDEKYHSPYQHGYYPERHTHITMDERTLNNLSTQEMKYGLVPQHKNREEMAPIDNAYEVAMGFQSQPPPYFGSKPSHTRWDGEIGSREFY